MKTNAILFLTIILLTPLCFAQVVFEEAFEQGTNAPDGWQTKVWQGKGEFQYPVTGKNGNAVQISSSEGGDLSWFKEVDVSPFAQYKLSGWIKTDNIQLENGAGALLNIHGIDGARTEELW
jgi:alpha-N-arabinofuranosidase